MPLATKSAQAIARAVLATDGNRGENVSLGNGRGWQTGRKRPLGDPAFLGLFTLL
jgi:hypothetical protein